MRDVKGLMLRLCCERYVVEQTLKQVPCFVAFAQHRTAVLREII